MSGISIDSKVYDLIKKDLDATALRSKVSANNIANVNTQNFKASYVSFEETFNEKMLDLKTTDQKHIKTNNEEGTVSVEKDTTTSMRTDGNNVNIDNEMANQAANTLLYNAMITQISNRMSNTKTVINGGK